ncbi:TIGR02444 family protein [Pseudomonas capeferrum]|uniref:TIGR02444 family protein n=1 Tax=Pseudomonas capeferrum TaxID=1495066 RepID=UPI0015E332FA|nr:TIGR02444 family protein [Pseudomonas capeferrum]MBA1202216.1 TIGR02444 family protein [Pseudomonas capeferrum]
MHSDLWNHALALYARPGVETACLSLQTAGGDVCLLLCGTWLQARHVMPEAERVGALRELAGGWQRQVIEPLRQLRRQWRDEAVTDANLAALREQVKKLELEAERTLLERLEALALTWPRCSEVPMDDWLAWLAPDQGVANDALHQLRAAASALHAFEDGA